MTTRRTKPTILIVGNGSMGQRRLKIITELTNKYNIETVDPGGTGTYTELPDAGKFAMIFVCSPPSSHSAYLCEALSRDCPVFVEKPFCLPREVSAVNEVVAGAKVPVMVGHNLLWHEGFKAFKAKVQDIPTLAFYSARYGNRLTNWNRENQDAYSRYRSQGGGVLLDCLQDIELALEITGGMEPISHIQQVEGNPVTHDSEWQAVTLCRLPVNGTAVLHFDYLWPERVRQHTACGDGPLEIWTEDDPQAVHDSYVAETKAFVGWVESGTEPAWRPDPFRALQFVRRVYGL